MYRGDRDEPRKDMGRQEIKTVTRSGRNPLDILEARRIGFLRHSYFLCVLHEIFRSQNYRGFIFYFFSLRVARRPQLALFNAQNGPKPMKLRPKISL